jgi:hypothetical protein
VGDPVVGGEGVAGVSDGAEVAGDAGLVPPVDVTSFLPPHADASRMIVNGTAVSVRRDMAASSLRSPRGVSHGGFGRSRIGAVVRDEDDPSPAGVPGRRGSRSARDRPR